MISKSMYLSINATLFNDIKYYILILTILEYKLYYDEY